MSLLDFYQQHGISPVTQIGSQDEAFARRAALYRCLGLPPMAVRGANVLEVGPGTGEHARYTQSLRPKWYIAVEPNQVAASACRASGLFTYVSEETITAFPPLWSPYDLVLCEGLLGLSGTDSAALLESCVRHVAPGGVLVITTIDPISNHADTLRRAQAQRLIDRTAPLADQVAVLRPVFAPHLATLGQSFTRSVDDWIIDNLLNPASIGPTFSIPDACAVLDGRFDLLGCSPRFLVDWRWYKQSPSGLGWVIDAYWTQCHNLLDYRYVYPSSPPEVNQELFSRCQSVREEVRAFEAGTLPSLTFSPIDPDWFGIGWFGRGQQYLSFVKTA